MREIELRFWNTIGRKFERSDKYCIDGEGLLIAFNFEIFGYDNPVSFDKTCIVAQQYTGLKDKNGKKIFEWDIVAKNGENDSVEFDSSLSGFLPFSCWDSYSDNWEPHKCMVIGNIFENKELLK